MKKLIIIKLIILLIIFTSCSSKSAKKNSDNIDVNKSFLNNPLKAIYGKWKAIKFGESWVALNYGLPSSLELRKNKTFEFKVKISPVIFESQGKYTIDISSKPYKVTLYQTYPREVVYEGIFDFVNNNKIKIIFYNRKELSRPTYFKKLNINYFVRENN